MIREKKKRRDSAISTQGRLWLGAPETRPVAQRKPGVSRLFTHDRGLVPVFVPIAPATPAWTDGLLTTDAAGTARSNWMSTNMTDWIALATH